MTKLTKNKALSNSNGTHLVIKIGLIHTSSYLFIYILLCSLCSYSPIALGYSSKDDTIYTYQSADGVTSFSDIAPINLQYKKYRVDCYACEVDSLINWHKAKLYVTQHAVNINNAASVNNINPAFVRAIIHAESHFNVNAISKQGAQGLMQLMPRTARSLGVTKPLNAEQNIYGGTRHLARLLKKYKGSHSLAAAAYNAGEGAVKKYAGIPPFPETQVYVKRVNILLKRYMRSSKNQITKRLEG